MGHVTRLVLRITGKVHGATGTVCRAGAAEDSMTGAVQRTHGVQSVTGMVHGVSGLVHGVTGTVHSVTGTGDRATRMVHMAPQCSCTSCITASFGSK